VVLLVDHRLHHRRPVRIREAGAEHVPEQQPETGCHDVLFDVDDVLVVGDPRPGPDPGPDVLVEPLPARMPGEREQHLGIVLAGVVVEVVHRRYVELGFGAPHRRPPWPAPHEAVDDRRLHRVGRVVLGQVAGHVDSLSNIRAHSRA
jgi:hypothetical protein